MYPDSRKHVDKSVSLNPLSVPTQARNICNCSTTEDDEVLLEALLLDDFVERDVLDIFLWVRVGVCFSVLLFNESETQMRKKGMKSTNQSRLLSTTRGDTTSNKRANCVVQ